MQVLQEGRRGSISSICICLQLPVLREVVGRMSQLFLWATPAQSDQLKEKVFYCFNECGRSTANPDGVCTPCRQGIRKI